MTLLLDTRFEIQVHKTSYSAKSGRQTDGWMDTPGENNMYPQKKFWLKPNKDIMYIRYKVQLNKFAWNYRYFTKFHRFLPRKLRQLIKSNLFFQEHTYLVFRKPNYFLR